jgi:hypothetical protein
MTGHTKPDRFIPDQNPDVPCYDCGNSFGWEDYWIERYVDGVDFNLHEIVFLCDHCLEEYHKVYELHKRKEQNAQLGEFA